MGFKKCLIKNKDVLALIGYLIIVNEEIHALQIKLADSYLEFQRFTETDKKFYMDVLGNDDDKVSYNDARSAFKNESTDSKRSILELLYAIAKIDNERDKSEDDLLKDLSVSFNKPEIVKISLSAQNIVNDLKKSLKNSSNKADFDIDITPFQQIGKNDYKIVESTVKQSLSSSVSIKKRLEEQQRSIDSSEIKKTLDQILNNYDENVLIPVRRLNDDLDRKKEQASQGFSIALMGRTKAGKSTLHSIMCGEGEGFIGVGKQRTTRYNRVFHWNGLKIIDTPGIGAGESAGAEDTAIAMKVLSQADMICFVVATESIQDDVLNTMDTIASHNKPMIILLNYKKTLSTSVHKRRHLEAPDRWRNETGEKSIQGYINRIERNARDKGYERLIQVIPVYLLAARLGKEEQNSILYQTSGYPDFIQLIQNAIKKRGIIYKSQTILDETVCTLSECRSSLKQESEIIKQHIDKLTGMESRNMQKIEEYGQTVKKNITRGIQGEFDSFINQYVDRFVDEHYKSKDQKLISSDLEVLINKSRLAEHIAELANSEIQEYQKKITQLQKDVGTEFRYASLNIGDCFGYDSSEIIGKSFFPAKLISNLLSTFAGAFALIPGIGLAAGVILGLVSGLFGFLGGSQKSVAEKERRHKDKMKQALIDATHDVRKKVEKEIMKSIDNIRESDHINFAGIFNGLIETLSGINIEIIKYDNSLRERIETLNKAYAVRILEFITDNADSFRFRSEDIKVSRGKSTDGKAYFEIRTRVGQKFHPERMDGILNETLTVKKYY